jgi:hypothetical protein
VLTDRPSLRPIHYLGNKARLLEVIAASLDLVDPDRGRVVDLFTGSGVVAARLARQRDLVAVDIQEYARVIAAALLAPGRLDARALVGEAREREAALLETEIAALVAHEQASKPVPSCLHACAPSEPSGHAQLSCLPGVQA